MFVHWVEFTTNKKDNFLRASSFDENIIIGIEKDHKNTELNDIQNDLLEENDDCTSLENVDKISQIPFSSSISIFQSRRSPSPTPEDGKTVWISSERRAKIKGGQPDIGIKQQVEKDLEMEKTYRFGK